MFLFSVLEPIVMLNSSSAEILAIPHKMNAIAFIPNNQNRTGKQANASPVALLAYVCKKDIAWYFTKPIPKDTKRVNAITPIQLTIHDSHASNGMRITSTMTTKTKSAMLSSISPSWLVVLVFLATYPSKISLAQHRA